MSHLKTFTNRLFFLIITSSTGSAATSAFSAERCEVICSGTSTFLSARIVDGWNDAPVLNGHDELSTFVYWSHAERPSYPSPGLYNYNKLYEEYQIAGTNYVHQPACGVYFTVLERNGSIVKTLISSTLLVSNQLVIPESIPDLFVHWTTNDPNRYQVLTGPPHYVPTLAQLVTKVEKEFYPNLRKQGICR